MSASAPHRSSSRSTQSTQSTQSTPSRHSIIAPTTPSPGEGASGVTPKSEYLRNALQERRVRASTPLPSLATSSGQSLQGQPERTSSRASTSDPWLENARTDTTVSDGSPIPRRRKVYEDSPLVRKPTHRELESQQDKLKDTNFDLALRLRLLQERNNKLQDELDVAKERIEELEPAQELVAELKEKNNDLTLQIQGMEEDLVSLEENYDALNDECTELKSMNKECQEINQELIVEMEKRDSGLDEAADMIFHLEQENASLKKQLQQCSHIINGTPSFSADAAADTPPKQPARIYSIDESRPSTGHVDSDYFSQPASPQVRPEKPSGKNPTIGPRSERARDLVYKTLESRASVHELKKRMSQMSLPRLKNRPESPVPPVPPVTDIPRLLKRNDKRHQTEGASRPLTPVNSSLKAERSIPRSPAVGQGGLRDLYLTGESSSNGRPKKDQESLGNQRIEHGRQSPSVAALHSPNRHASRSARASSLIDYVAKDLEHSSSVRNPPSTGKLSPSSTVNDDQISRPNHRDRWWRDLSKLQEALPALSPVLRPAPRQEDLLFNPYEDEEQFMARVKQHSAPRR